MPTLSGEVKKTAGTFLTINRRYDVSIPSDSSTCCITDICVLENGQVLVADRGNHVVKLLDHEYQVSSHCRLSANIWSICLIPLSELAVTFDDDDRQYEIQFIIFNNGQLLPGRKLRLEHEGRCITNYNGDMYITSDTAIYQYTLTGKQVRKVYEDTSDSWTVDKCAVSPTGKILYITNYMKDMLLTLSIDDGSILSMFTDRNLRGLSNIHVTHAGHVLVCGYTLDTIIQLDSEGKNKLATLASEHDGVRDTASVCYNRHTASILVGTYVNMILVLDSQSNHMDSPSATSTFPVETLRTLQLEPVTREPLEDTNLHSDSISESSTLEELSGLFEIHNEKENTLQSIYTYARTAYQRSEVPENERTSIPPEKTYNYPETIDAIINRLLQIEDVIGCSKHIGQLEILIDNTSDIDGTSSKVNELLKHEDVKYILIYGKFKPFIAPGDEVTAAHTPRVATLLEAYPIPTQRQRLMQAVHFL